MKSKNFTIESLRNSKLSTHQDEYIALLETISKDNYKHILHLLIENNDSDSIFKNFIISFINKICINITDSDPISEILPYLLPAIRNIDDSAQILLTILENLNLRKDSDSIMRVLEALKKTKFSPICLVDLLYKNETSNLITEILIMNDHLVDEFIREAIQINNQNVIKNLSQVLPSLNIKHFVNYNSFMILFENENYSLRNAMVEIIENLILYFKENNNIETIRELTVFVEERLCDVNFYVRGKTLSCIANLFRKECILKDQRNSLLKEIIGRVNDKTVIVRKKAISLLSQLLLNHPFKNRQDLSQSRASELNHQDINKENPNFKNMQDVSNGKDKLSNFKNNSKEMNLENLNDTATRIENDFNEFVGLMHEALQNIVSLLSYDVKTDLNEIVCFIKIAYLLKLNGSEEALSKILSFVYSKDKEFIVSTFKEIVEKREDVLYEFINNKAFAEVLRYLDIDGKVLYRNFYNGYKAYESIYVLQQLKQKISEENSQILLAHTTDMLFQSKDENSLKENVKIYNCVLNILKGMRNRISENHDILKLVNKNIIKMIFYEKSIIRYTVELFYHISLNPEKNCQKLLKNLCLSQSLLKILDCVGWVALNHFYLLERLEKKYKISKTVDGENYRNLRKSLENIDNINDLRERRKSLEETRRRSIDDVKGLTMKVNDYSRISLRFDELQESMKNKSEEEIADFFFFLKERELIYSGSSILNQFIPLLRESLTSSKASVQVVAYSTLNKLMLISSEFFNEFHNTFILSLSHGIAAVKNNAVVAMHDFIIYYNSLIDSSVVFDLLADDTVKKNAALVIFSLMHKNIIRIKNNATKLVGSLFDLEIGLIVKNIIKTFSSNNNTMSVIFYETFSSHLSDEHLKYLCQYVGQSIQESLLLKCIKSGAAIERIKVVYDNFNISEKFIQQNSHLEEIRIFTGNSA